MTVQMSEVARETAHRERSDARFWVALGIIGGLYVLLVVAMVVADVAYTTPAAMLKVLRDPAIRYSIKLSLVSCSITTILALWVAVPLGYIMSRWQAPRRKPGEPRRVFWNWLAKGLVDATLDIPIVLPPLVIGLCLLILFQTPLGRVFQRGDISIFGWRLPPIPITYAVPSVIIAQFAVACAFAVRTMKVTFDQISPRGEQVALTLGCTRGQAFWLVVLPEAKRGMLAAGTLAWARALGEFGPILVFSGATRMRTEVLPTSVFLELSLGRLPAALAVSLLMIAAAVIVLIIVRLAGSETTMMRGAT